MEIVRNARDSAAHAVMATVGVVFGILSAAALAVAAVVPAVLGVLAFLASPFRALLERLRGG
jgi:hypothetical protein